MKAVIVEINDNHAAVLSDDGCITSIKNVNYEIGQVIQLNRPKSTFIKKLTVFTASAAACIIFGVSTWAYASPYTYVSVDVNPSLEFVVNRFDRVLKVKGVNDDGDQIVNVITTKNLKNKKIENALKSTFQQISNSGYFEDDTESGIIIATSSKDANKANELAQELQETIIQESANTGDSIMVESFSVGLDRVQEAKELGVTPGKLNLVEKLQDAVEDSTTINLKEWLDKPVKEIMKATKDYNKTNKVKEDVPEASSDETIVADAPEQEDQTNQNEVTLDNKDENDSGNALSQSEKEAKKAQNDAETAQKEAAKAQKIAKEAQENSEKKSKEAAKEHNAVAKSEAKVAERNAAKAKETANVAQQAADVAQKKADAAQKKADDAKKKADDAKKKADDAKKQADDAKKQVDKAQKDIKSHADNTKASSNKNQNSGLID